ncbi:MAG TPA: DUF4404 family protein [Anaerolineales bacterium]|nr:DUF4404 family protein [Anaerolineales bacterium]
MTDQKLPELLQQLHDELEKTESVDEEGREMLAHLNADIRKFIDPAEEDDDTIFEQIRDAIDRFEVEYPSITAALSQILNTLSNAGI